MKHIAIFTTLRTGRQSIHRNGHGTPGSSRRNDLKIMYLIFVTDAALNIWFNCAPQLDASGIKLPLPCDDAAWTLVTKEGCARALGLWRRSSSGSQHNWQFTAQA